MVDFSIKDQVAVVTGGTGMLCADMCRALAEAGAKVAVLGHRSAPAEALAVELGTMPLAWAVTCSIKRTLPLPRRKFWIPLGE